MTDKEKLKKAIEALRFYADSSNYSWSFWDSESWKEYNILDDDAHKTAIYCLKLIDEEKP